MKNTRLAISAAVLALALFLFLGLHHYQNHSKLVSACGFRADETISIGSKKISVEVADTQQSREKGLSGRPCITENEGMLFTYDRPGQYSFWMKGMKFPIDIIWISTAKKAVVIQEDVQPSTYPDSFINPSIHPAQYILELKDHQSTVLSINPGTPINF